MAISGSTVLEVRNVADYAGASDTNGGGFVTGASGTDWSQQGSPQYSVADGVTAGTTTITSATAAFGTDVVGNLISVSGGTGSVVQSWYQITARGSATSITVDRAAGLTAGTGVTLKVGGALATPGVCGTIFALGAAGIRGWCKYSTTAFSLTTATPGSGGPLSLPSAIACTFEGYDQTRGDRTGNQPQISWASVASPGSLTYICAASISARQRFANLAANGNAVNNVGGFNLPTSNRAEIIQCAALNFTGSSGVGFTLAAGWIKSCRANTCLVGFAGAGYVASSDAVNCTSGYSGTTNNVDCLARQCITGFTGSFTLSIFDRCTADSNTTGFLNNGAGTFMSCIASNHTGGTGFNIGTNICTFENCASYNNLTEISGTSLVNEGMILNASFTGGQPYMVAGSDFRPNATAGAGALLRGAGIGVFGQTDNADIGAVQHADPSVYVINKTINNYYYNEPEP